MDTRLPDTAMETVIVSGVKIVIGEARHHIDPKGCVKNQALPMALLVPVSMRGRLRRRTVARSVVARAKQGNGGNHNKS